MNDIITDMEIIKTSHHLMSVLMVIIWCIVGWAGLIIKPEKQKNKITKLYLLLAIGQEIWDYINRIFILPNEIYTITLKKDLPLHPCHYAFILLLFLMFRLTRQSEPDSKMNRFFFNFSFYIGFTAGFQGILTPDFSVIYNMHSMVTGHFQHSLIILYVIWLMTAYDFRPDLSGIFQALFALNILALPTIPINLWLNGNYMYICEVPNTDNPLLIGEWPWYIFFSQVVFVIYSLLLICPFLIHKKFWGEK